MQQISMDPPNITAAAACSKQRRRASMGSYPLPAIREQQYGDSSVPDRHLVARRRSSVGFSSNVEVMEYHPEPAHTNSERFYTPEDIYQFRQEARFERRQARMTRRASTGSCPQPPGHKQGLSALTIGIAAPSAAASAGYVYPYISPNARKSLSASASPDTSSISNNNGSCNSNNNNDSTSTVGSSSSGSSGSSSSVASLDGITLDDCGTPYIPVMTFSSFGDKDKKDDDSSQHTQQRRHSLLCALPAANMSAKDIALGRRNSTESIHVCSSAQALTVPIDRIRSALRSSKFVGDANWNQDLAAAQCVSVSLPHRARRPSTARIA